MITALQDIVVFALLIQLFFWLLIFRRLATFPLVNKIFRENEIAEPVSIIICAKNEVANLRKNLPFILRQSGSDFEVIVVDDQSDDETLSTLKNFQLEFANLKVLSTNGVLKNLEGKKQALTLGIEAAQYDALLLTDADCCPVGPNWLDKMRSQLKGDTTIVLGVGPLYKHPGLLNAFQRFETVYTAVQYLSFALAGLPYMGVGRNLMYRKQLFIENGGMEPFAHHVSGDDDLFVNATATKNNTAIQLDKDSFVYSEGKTSWKDYFIQKRRHLSVGSSYNIKTKFVLGLLTISHIFSQLGFLGCLILCKWTGFILFLYLLRAFIQFILYARILKRLRAFSLFKGVLFLDFIFILYYLIFAIAILIPKSVKWK